MKDRCGFLFVHYKRHCCTELVSWEHAACPLSGIKKCPLVGGWLDTSSVVISIGAIASVRYREIVHSWEVLLWEVPLYTFMMSCFLSRLVFMRPPFLSPISLILFSPPPTSLPISHLSLVSFPNCQLYVLTTVKFCGIAHHYRLKCHSK